MFLNEDFFDDETELQNQFDNDDLTDDINEEKFKYSFVFHFGEQPCNYIKSYLLNINKWTLDNMYKRYRNDLKIFDFTFNMMSFVKNCSISAHFIYLGNQSHRPKKDFGEMPEEEFNSKIQSMIEECYAKDKVNGGYNSYIFRTVIYDELDFTFTATFDIRPDVSFYHFIKDLNRFYFYGIKKIYGRVPSFETYFINNSTGEKCKFDTQYFASNESENKGTSKKIYEFLYQKDADSLPDNYTNKTKLLDYSKYEYWKRLLCFYCKHPKESATDKFNYLKTVGINDIFWFSKFEHNQFGSRIKVEHKGTTLIMEVSPKESAYNNDIDITEYIKEVFINKLEKTHKLDNLKERDVFFIVNDPDVVLKKYFEQNKVFYTDKENKIVYHIAFGDGQGNYIKYGKQRKPHRINIYYNTYITNWTKLLKNER